MIRKLIAAVVLGLLLAAQAGAASMSITGPTDILPGETFELGIIGDFFGEGLIAGGIRFIWDDAAFQLDDVTRSFGAEDFSCPGSSNCPANTANSTAIVWGEFLNDLIGVNEGPLLMATLTFTAIGSPSVPAPFFVMESFDDLTGGWFGAGFIPIDTPTLSGFPPVPLPSAIWLMLGGLGTLLGYRRN